MVNSAIFKCAICRKLRGRIEGQMMADLPKDRFKEAPPFTYCTVDMFGPFTVRVKRSDMKRDVEMFTCLASRTPILRLHTVLMPTHSSKHREDKLLAEEM